MNITTRPNKHLLTFKDLKNGEVFTFVGLNPNSQGPQTYMKVVATLNPPSPYNTVDIVSGHLFISNPDELVVKFEAHVELS